MTPEERLTLRFCPVCGRDDRSIPFTGKGHYHCGERCSGQPVEATYILLPPGSIILAPGDAHEIREALRCAILGDPTLCRIALEVLDGTA